MRSYVDTYYVKNAPAVLGKVAPPVVSPVWRDYASIVVAVARADADPTTPDQARGAGSIRVGFRDWIGPWLQFHYFDPVQLQPAIVDIRTKLQPHFTADYFDSVNRLKNEVTTLVGPNRGLVGRIRDLQVVHGAFDGITVGQPADLVQKVSQTMQQVVAFQQAFEPVQAGTLSASDGKLGLDALTSSAVSAATDVGAVKSQVAVDPDEGRHRRRPGRHRARHAGHARRPGRRGEQLARVDLELGSERQQPGQQGPAALPGGGQGSVPVAEGCGARRPGDQAAPEPAVSGSGAHDPPAGGLARGRGEDPRGRQRRRDRRRRSPRRSSSRTSRTSGSRSRAAPPARGPSSARFTTPRPDPRGAGDRAGALHADRPRDPRRRRGADRAGVRLRGGHGDGARVPERRDDGAAARRRDRAPERAGRGAPARRAPARAAGGARHVHEPRPAPDGAADRAGALHADRPRDPRQEHRPARRVRRARRTGRRAPGGARRRARRASRSSRSGRSATSASR